MSKWIWVLIGGLVIVVVVISAVAFYRIRISPQNPVVHEEPVVPEKLIVHTDAIIYPIPQTLLDNCPQSTDMVYCLTYATRLSRAVCQEELKSALRRREREFTGKSFEYAGREAEWMLDANNVLYGRHFVSEYYADDPRGVEELWDVSCSFSFLTWEVENYSLSVSDR